MGRLGKSVEISQDVGLEVMVCDICKVEASSITEIDSVCLQIDPVLKLHVEG
jgi:hypothetical protein